MTLCCSTGERLAAAEQTDLTLHADITLLFPLWKWIILTPWIKWGFFFCTLIAGMCQRYLGMLPVSLCVTIHAVSTARLYPTLGGPKSSFIKTTFKNHSGSVQHIASQSTALHGVCVCVCLCLCLYVCFCKSGSSQWLRGDINSW